MNFKNVKATFIWSSTTINDTLSYLIPSILDDTLSVNTMPTTVYRILVLWGLLVTCGVVEVPYLIISCLHVLEISSIYDWNLWLAPACKLKIIAYFVIVR